MVAKKPKTKPKTKPKKAAPKIDPKKTKPASKPVVKSSSPQEYLSKIKCVECDEFIPAARLKIVDTDTCAPCMEELELMDRVERVRLSGPGEQRGTVRHTMEFEVSGIEEVESIELHVRRGK